MLVIAFWVAAALLAPYITDYSPSKQEPGRRMQPPNSLHRFGTDQLGRDVASRVLFGARVTIPAACSVVFLSACLGVMVGAVAGYLEGGWDDLLMKVAELFMAFPTLLFAMAITASLGPGIRNAVLALAVVSWPNYARLMRTLVIKTKMSAFVYATRSLGAPPAYVLFRTVLPNCFPHAIVLATLDIGSAAMAFAGLSFLGLGTDPTSAEWGRMVADGIGYFDQWWTWLFPSIALASMITACNFMGDEVRELFDPQLRTAAPRLGLAQFYRTYLRR